MALYEFVASLVYIRSPRIDRATQKDSSQINKTNKKLTSPSLTDLCLLSLDPKDSPDTWCCFQKIDPFPSRLRTEFQGVPFLEAAGLEVVPI